MPRVLQVGAYRFFFYSLDGVEPPHIHVRAGGKEAKFWLNPIRLAFNYGFNGRELNRIERIVADNEELFLERWHEYFDDQEN